jgi:Primase C terminal 2 (PriCT-2)
MNCPQRMNAQGQDEVFISFFTSAAARKRMTTQMSLPALRNMIQKTSANAKAKLPWLKLAKFGNKLSSEGCLRHNANVLEISGVEVDYDGERIPFDTALAVLRAARLEALIYTSPSHSKAKPRWRILAPTSKALPPVVRAQLVARLNGLFGGVVAEESFVLSQSYYFGSIDNNPAHRTRVLVGDCIDQRRDLDAGAIGKSEREPEPQGDARKRATEPIDPDLIVAALEVTPSEQYRPWLQIGAALRFEMGDDGFALFDRWSKGSSKYNANQSARKWRECAKFTKYTGRTILFYADQAAPGWREEYEITQWQNFLNNYVKPRR